ncbi:uncharacterized protein [Spinacia oleracea]|uniref:Retrotransposon Copia-like N-terminal domain-containing protein n=1 Tax=Spinacia oleracea TaxID=3562 RepID=A0A9R0IJL6_SPIOL|nr:uncharacterized protein LOC110789429 [Spinacia oleracea]
MPGDQQTEPATNPNSAYYLSNNDLNAPKLVNIVFEGKCFNDWKRSMIIALSARNKLCFVDGSLNQPAANSPNFRIWNRCNDLVISWILASLEPSIGRSVLYLRTAREIWLDLEERFCQSSGPQLYTIQQQLNDLNHEENEEISSFFTKIKLLWDQLDGLDPIPACVCTGCSCTLTLKLLKIQQNQRLIQFLMKLSQKFDHSKSSILMMNPLPTISKAYGLLLQEEQQKGVYINKTQPTESAAFATRRFNENNKPYRNVYTPGNNNISHNTAGQARNYSYNRNNLFCEHCRMKNHTIDKCWKLHGYPKDFKNKGKRVAASAQLEYYAYKDKQSEEDSGMIHATFTEE